MNQYVLAIIGLLAVFIVGVICYGLLFKGFIGDDNAVKLTPTRFGIAAIGMYVLALAFIVLYKDVAFMNNITGTLKGLYLGLWVGVPFFLVPLFADAPYFKSKTNLEWAVIANWVLSFVVLGIVVGAIGVS